jgi:hypothetical protein
MFNYVFCFAAQVQRCQPAKAPFDAPAGADALLRGL